MSVGIQSRQVSDYSVLRDVWEDAATQLKNHSSLRVIYSFHKYLLGTYYIPGTILTMEINIGKKKKKKPTHKKQKPAPCGIDLFVGVYRK